MNNRITNSKKKPLKIDALWETEKSFRKQMGTQ